MDFFQTLCIVTGKVKSSGCSGIDGWHACRYDLNDCSAPQMATMIEFEENFVATFRATAAQASKSSSGFLYSCHNHVAGDSPLFDRIVSENASMRSAVDAWWDGGAAGPGGYHTSPCMWKPAGIERKCNPTCYKDGLV